jgi:hypothetical protein
MEGTDATSMDQTEPKSDERATEELRIARTLPTLERYFFLKLGG